MTKKPKTAEQINKEKTGSIEIVPVDLKDLPTELKKICQQCLAAHRAELLQEIEKHRKFFKNPEGVCFYLTESWWQQFKKGESVPHQKEG